MRTAIRLGFVGDRLLYCQLISTLSLREREIYHIKEGGVVRGRSATRILSFEEETFCKGGGCETRPKKGGSNFSWLRHDVFYLI